MQCKDAVEVIPPPREEADGWTAISYVSGREVADGDVSMMEFYSRSYSEEWLGLLVIEVRTRTSPGLFVVRT